MHTYDEAVRTRLSAGALYEPSALCYVRRSVKVGLSERSERDKLTVAQVVPRRRTGGYCRMAVRVKPGHLGQDISSTAKAIFSRK